MDASDLAHPCVVAEKLPRHSLGYPELDSFVPLSAPLLHGFTSTKKKTSLYNGGIRLKHGKLMYELGRALNLMF